MNETTLDSGYVVKIRLTGPFAFDHITQAHPYPDRPVRKIKLAGGAVEDWPYTPPKEEPTEQEEKDLYNHFLAWRVRCAEVDVIRQRKLSHYFMMEHIEVVSGPGGKFLWRVVNFIKRLYHWWGKTTPTNAVYIHFLKTLVIASTRDWKTIQDNSIAKEVEMEGLLDAAERFRDVLGRDPTEGGDQVDSQRQNARVN